MEPKEHWVSGPHVHTISAVGAGRKTPSLPVSMVSSPKVNAGGRGPAGTRPCILERVLTRSASLWHWRHPGGQ